MMTWSCGKLRMCGIDWRTASAVPWYHFSDAGVCSAASTVTKPPRNRSKTYERAMWLFRLAELYCVTTKIRSSPELMQLETGTSTRRYLPASGTAGLARWRVSGNSRVPAPPPRITASIRFIAGAAKVVLRGGRDRTRGANCMRGFENREEADLQAVCGPLIHQGPICIPVGQSGPLMNQGPTA